MYGLDESKPYDVVGIGNAILDIIAEAEDNFLIEQSMVKGTMQLIDDKRAAELYEEMGQTKEVSGGSAANTLAGMAQLGSRTAFIGKVRDDQLGRIYRHDLCAVGVHFDTPPTTEGAPTGCSYILVTPDAERTMNTYLGAGSEIYEEDVTEELIGNAKIVYGEGYQWSTPKNKDALRKAFVMARENDAKVAFTLSDVFCVEHHRTDFQILLAEHFDVLFANEQEVEALYPDLSFEDIMDKIQGVADVVAVTRGAEGSIILTPEERIEVKAAPVGNLVDTTGAGDLYAAGFLHGYCVGRPLVECGRLGSACAAEIIQQLGARSMHSLKDKVA